ncbi:MAG: CHC2 zinc finger domain-containing protein [Planctomycetia bacterium]|nr:CHC2 zinc finger domain-containing protein [Planctomycetia bacterium]
MSTRDFDQREQIRDAIDIVDLVERYVPLRRQGANYVGRCPWHDDSRPSLQVNATRQTFKCWVCNIGGDVFSFVMRIENVEFPEAMQILADMAGITLVKRRKRLNSPPPTPQLPPPEYDEQADGTIVEGIPLEALNRQASSQEQAQVQPLEEIPKSSLYSAMAWLARQYRRAFLNSPEAEEARKYVEQRGISEESSERYMIGYAPMNASELLRWVKFDRQRARILETTGTLAYRDDYDQRGRILPRPAPEKSPTLTNQEQARYYDRFRGRLIFPIRDVQDRVVAFGGRLLPNTTLKSPAKYVNSPETPIFTKSKMVYGLDLARNAIRQSGMVMITEGYTDCIMTSQFGFGNVVAVLGTALGAQHVRILKRFADKMILLLDGDQAGQKRASEVLRFFVEQGVDMSVLTLPNNADPCEFLLEHGADAFEKLLKTDAVSALDHAFNVATRGIDLDRDVVAAAKALDSLLDVLALFPEEQRQSNDPARLRMIGALQRYATLFHIEPQELRRQLDEKRKQTRYYQERDAQRELARENIGRDQNQNASAPQENYRANWVYPIASARQESEQELQERFPPFETYVWHNQSLMPSLLEREYLQLWLTDPSVLPELLASIQTDDLRSPVTQQLDLLARDYFERDLEPTFERILLRYTDDNMKLFLINLDEQASKMELGKALENQTQRARLVGEIIAGFQRARMQREAPKQLSQLREKDASAESKLNALLAIQRQRQAFELNRNGNDEDAQKNDDSAPF